MPFPKPPLSYNLATDFDTFIHDWYSEKPIWDNSQRWLSVEESIAWAKTGGVYSAYQYSFSQGYTPSGGLVQQMYIAPVQQSSFQTSQDAANAEAARIAQQTADALEAKKQATLEREQAAKEALQAETFATGSVADQIALQSYASGLMQTTVPSPMGCDWVGTYARSTGASHISVSLQSVFGNPISALDISGYDIRDAKSRFIDAINSMAGTTPGMFYTNIVKNISASIVSCNSKADADAEIMKAVVDLNRFPKIPYDAICASRADCVALVSLRQKTGTSSSIIVDDLQSAQGNYPANTQQTSEVLGTLPAINVQVESDFGYEDSLAQTIIPSIPDSIGAPLVSIFPAPATGDNYEHTAKGGGAVVSPSTLGTNALDVATYVNSGLQPAAFGSANEALTAAAEYAARQTNSQSGDPPLADEAWALKLKEYTTAGVMPSDFNVETWEEVKKQFLDTYQKSVIPESVNVTATQDNSEWWTVGGVMLLVIGLAYLGSRGT